MSVPHQKPTAGFPLRVEVNERERPGHAAVKHGLIIFCLHETERFGLGLVRVVVYRFAVLDEAPSGLHIVTLELRDDVADAVDFAAEMDEILNLLVPRPAASTSTTPAFILWECMCMVFAFSTTTRPNTTQTSTIVVIVVARLCQDLDAITALPAFSMAHGTSLSSSLGVFHPYQQFDGSPSRPLYRSRSGRK